MNLGAECLGDRVVNADPPCPHCGLVPPGCGAPDACRVCECDHCRSRREDVIA